MDVQHSLTECDAVLVAFDGPVAELPPMDAAAERLRAMVADARLPRKVARTADPLAVLDYAATIGPATAAAVHTQLGRLEHELVSDAALRPGAAAAIKTMASAGAKITVVSSLTHAAIRTFLVLHGMIEDVAHIAGRARPDRSVLPPAPDLLTGAIRGRAVEDCAFVASTAADLAAGRAAGIRTYRHHPVEPSTPWFEALS
jgi:beta-phosphoglucomutase-like phosphatase (HAD superfamily)